MSLSASDPATPVARPHISAVVAVYGCADCLRALHTRLSAALAEITPSYEIVLIEDHSRDDSWPVARELAETDPHVRAFRLSRNFGQHAAITAGLAEARGEWAVVLDCDLQDPPEEIKRLYAKAMEGYDVVFARRKRKPASLYRRLTARLYFKGLNAFTGAGIEGEYGTFSLISRKVIDAYVRMQDQDRHYLFILYWLGFSQAAVDYEPAPRFAGESSYTFASLIKHGLNGVFFQTTVLLRAIVYFGFALSATGGLMALYLIISRLTGDAFPGFTTLAVLVLTVGGFIIISTGITGLYIGKVFDQAKARPIYVIDERVEAGEHTVAAEAAEHRESVRAS